ncbi:proprotein convertase subtilisin/kexin type 5-like [Argopecten irradians]|uniref:proprotein convertase subtilisin/kexin type 5-like n=1 Tax=Argopecten irradians TaxID=31199 RepID=UPI003718D752
MVGGSFVKSLDFYTRNNVNITSKSFWSRYISITMDIRDVLIIMTIFILTQQHQTNLTGSVLFNNNGHILAECPNTTLQIEFSSACTDTCPESAPFLFGTVCLSFCPVGYVAHAGTCMYDIPRREQETKINLICPTEFCPLENPYCDEYRCVTTCPQGMYIEEQSCVYTCSKSKPHMFNYTCVMDCPRTYPYTENNICVMNCSIGYVQLGNSCVKACPHGKYRTKTNCVDSCSSEGMFELVIWNTGLCLANCPLFTNINGNICNTHCPHGSDLLWNMSCVGQCPDSMPFVYVLSKRLPPFETPVCLPVCPDQTYVDGRTCVVKCSQGMRIDDRNCVRNCPSVRKFIHQEKCLSICPSNLVVHGTSCVQNCPANAKYTFNSTCIDKCPTGYAVLGDECVTSCPGALILFQGKCSLTCPNDLFIFNGSCVDRCPLTHQYKDVSSVNSVLAVIACRQSCTKPYIYNMTCSDYCPHDTYRYNHTCVDNCSKIGMFGHYSICVSKCPSGYIINDDSCSRSCPKETPFVFNGSCRSECLSTHTIHLPDWLFYQKIIRCVNSCSSDRVEFNGKCVDRCPVVTAYFNGSCVEECPLSHKFNTTSDYFRYKYQCVSNCKVNAPFSLEDKCVNICPHFSINSSCVARCPESHSFVYHERAGRSQCVKECPGNTYTIYNKCYKQCLDPLVSFLGNLSCLQQCPTTHKFRYMYSNNEKLFRCEKTCSKPLFISGDKCLHNCPVSKPYSKGQTCVATCGSSYPFFHPVTKQCLKDCPQPYVLSNNTCIQKCPPDARFLVNNVCTKSCPPAMKLWSPQQKGNVCGSTCTHGFVEQNKTCVTSCSGGHVIINNKCTGSKYCPREYKYTESSSNGNICRKSCLKGQYIQSLTCVRQCSKYYVENECVDRCPITHPYTDIQRFRTGSFPKECHKNCKPSQYVEGFHCTSLCNSGLYIAMDKTCVNKCPPSHPFRRKNILDAVCDKACGDSYLVDQNNNCMEEQKCKDQKDMFIYKDKCVQECPPHSFLDMTNTRCLSLSDGTLIIGFILITISMALVVCTCCLLKCRYPSFQTNKSKDLEDNDEESHLLLDVNGEGDCGAETCQEIHDLSSSGHYVPARDCHNEQVSMANTSIPMVQVHAPMVPVFDELQEVYVGEKDIDENTQVKTTKDEEIDESRERLTSKSTDDGVFLQ